MAYFRKCKTMDILKILQHYNREVISENIHRMEIHNKEGEVVDEENQIEYINCDCTQHNYTIEYKNDGTLKHRPAPTKRGAVKAEKLHSLFEKRIVELPHRHTSATVGMCVWVVDCPEILRGDKKEMKRFFELIYKYTVERYGADNVFVGFVHMDENAPNIKIPFVPAYAEKKTDNNDELELEYRLNARSLITRFELKNYQQELDKLCANKDNFGIPRLILTKVNKTTCSKKRKQELDEQKRIHDKKIQEDNEYSLTIRMALKLIDDIIEQTILDEIVKAEYISKRNEIEESHPKYRRKPTKDDIPDDIPPIQEHDWLITRERWFYETGSWYKAPSKFSDMMSDTSKSNIKDEHIQEQLQMNLYQV